MRRLCAKHMHRGLGGFWYPWREGGVRVATLRAFKEVNEGKLPQLYL